MSDRERERPRPAERTAERPSAADRLEQYRQDAAKAMDEADALEAKAMEARAKAESARALAELTAAEVLDEERRADAPPSVPAPWRRNAAGVAELDQSPATPEQVAAHERRAKRES